MKLPIVVVTLELVILTSNVPLLYSFLLLLELVLPVVFNNK